MVRSLCATFIGLIVLGTTACSGARPRGHVVRIQEAAEPRAKNTESPLNGSEGYAISRRGSILEVPSSPEDAAVFHFSIGQAYSLDNDPQRAVESYRATLVHDPKSALVRARLAAELVKTGGFAEARILCEEAIQLEPKYVDSYLLLAGIQVAAKEYEKAIATYGQALKVDPKNRDALLYLGVTLAEIGKVKEGVSQLEKLVKLKEANDSNIDQAVAFYYLAKIQDQAGNRDQAIQAYGQALKKRPSFAKAALALSDKLYARNEPEKATKVLVDCFAEGRSAEIAERLAERHLEKNDYKGAVSYLETLVEEDPTNENMKLRLALVYWQVRWLDKARLLLSDLHARYPGSSEIAYYLGELEIERSDFEAALQYYRRVSSDYGKFDQMVARVAYAYRQQSKMDAAEDYLLEAMRKRPDLVAFYPLLAAVYEDQKRLEESRLVLERGEKLFPNDENILYYLGFTLDRLGAKERALDKMQHLLTINPENANALNFVGYTLAERNERLADAEAYLAKALKLKPEDPFILDSYGWLLYRTGQHQLAMKHLERAFAAKPSEGVIAEHLADVYVSLSLPLKAVQVYEQALKTGGDQEFKARVLTKLANVREVLANSDHKNSGTSMDQQRDPPESRLEQPTKKRRRPASKR
jgi:tetratricopeptide (TPR) repeat protein